MTIIAPKVDSSIFIYDVKTKTFVGEMSELGKFGRVYDDACDLGFTMVSAKTGKEVTFVVNGTLREHGETVGWRLVPVTGTVRKMPTLAGVTVHVFND